MLGWFILGLATFPPLFRSRDPTLHCAGPLEDDKLNLAAWDVPGGHSRRRSKRFKKCEQIADYMFYVDNL
jgi:hypothetical protein